MADLPDIDEVIEGNEMMEKRGRLKEITQETAESQMQGWQPSLPHLARVNEAARKHRELKFTNLLHHIDVAALERAFRHQRASASAWDRDGPFGNFIRASSCTSRRAQRGT